MHAESQTDDAIPSSVVMHIHVCLGTLDSPGTHKIISHWPGFSNPGQVLSCLSFSEMGHFLAYGNR